MFYCILADILRDVENWNDESQTIYQVKTECIHEYRQTGQIRNPIHRIMDATTFPELIEMEQLWETRNEPPIESDVLPPLEWIEEMTECLRMLVEYGDEDAVYGKRDHARSNREMYLFIRESQGMHRRG